METLNILNLVSYLANIFFHMQETNHNFLPVFCVLLDELPSCVGCTYTFSEGANTQFFVMSFNCALISSLLINSFLDVFSFLI